MQIDRLLPQKVVRPCCHELVWDVFLRVRRFQEGQLETRISSTTSGQWGDKGSKIFSPYPPGNTITTLCPSASSEDVREQVQATAGPLFCMVLPRVQRPAPRALLVL